MKQLVHRFVCLSIVVFLMLSVSFVSNAEDTVYVRKHVSLVYDNSGSMRSQTEWAYASYAAQMFAGLLNDTDTLTVTFLDYSEPLEIRLTEDRQDIVERVRRATSSAEGETPIEQVFAGLDVLKSEGLDSNGSSQNGEQYWLVMMTDGQYQKDEVQLEKSAVAEIIESELLQAYPNLHVVYFGMGSSAFDFRGSESGVPDLKAYPNFSQAYAENDNEIITSMQALSNQIAGRYSVQKSIDIKGNTVALDINGETSPIRNIAVLAQNTDAVLVSASSQNGTGLQIDRLASIEFPYHDGYPNVPDTVKGGYSALLTTSKGDKIPPGKVVLEFSEPVNADSLSLMYEPAVYIRVDVERKLSDGSWEAVPVSKPLTAGNEIRIDYTICEADTDEELDPQRLFGQTQETITCGNQTVQPGQSIITEEGDLSIGVNLSMMDGAYQISTSRNVHVQPVGAEDFDIISSGPLSLRRSEIADNKDNQIDFTIVLYGEVPSDDYMNRFALSFEGKGGKLDGKEERIAPNTIRYIPKDDDCTAGEYTLNLTFDGKAVTSETITVLPNEVTYTAEPGPELSIMSNEVGTNDRYVYFTVTAHRDEGDSLITAQEADAFTITAVGENGTILNGRVSFEDGMLLFTPRDSVAGAGDYTVRLELDGTVLGETTVAVLQYNAAYTVDVVVSPDNTVDRLRLNRNEDSVSFIVYADGVPCTSSQLSAMYGNEITVTPLRWKHYMALKVDVGTADGLPALVCTPTAGAGNPLGFLQRFAIAWGAVPLGDLDITVTVDMPKGCTATGTLNVVNNLFWMWFYRLLPVIIAILIIIVCWIWQSNLRSARLFRGVVWSFRVYCDNARFNMKYHVTELEKVNVGIRRKQGMGSGYLLAAFKPLTEKGGIGLWRYSAGTGNAAAVRKFYQAAPRSAPVLSRTIPTSSLREYYYQPTADEERTVILREIRNEYKNTLTADEMNRLNMGTCLEDDYLSGGDNTGIAGETKVSRLLTSNTYIFQRTADNNGNHQYRFWVFTSTPSAH